MDFAQKWGLDWQMVKLKLEGLPEKGDGCIRVCNPVRNGNNKPLWRFFFPLVVPMWCLHFVNSIEQSKLQIDRTCDVGIEWDIQCRIKG